MTDGEKEYEIHWVMKGSYKLKAQSHDEAYQKASEIDDMSDPDATYEIDRVNEVN